MNLDRCNYEGSGSFWKDVAIVTVALVAYLIFVVVMLWFVVHVLIPFVVNWLF